MLSDRVKAPFVYLVVGNVRLHDGREPGSAGKPAETHQSTSSGSVGGRRRLLYTLSTEASSRRHKEKEPRSSSAAQRRPPRSPTTPPPRQNKRPASSPAGRIGSGRKLKPNWKINTSEKKLEAKRKL